MKTSLLFISSVESTDTASLKRKLTVQDEKDLILSKKKTPTRSRDRSEIKMSSSESKKKSKTTLKQSTSTSKSSKNQTNLSTSQPTESVNSEKANTKASIIVLVDFQLALSSENISVDPANESRFFTDCQICNHQVVRDPRL